MWEKSRLICSSLRELQEEHRKGVLSFTMHKAPIGASECRLTSRRGLVPGYWTLSGQQVGEQYLQVEPLWFVLFLYLFWIFFFVSRGLWSQMEAPNLCWVKPLGLSVGMWKWAGVVKMGRITLTCIEYRTTDLFPVFYGVLVSLLCWGTEKKSQVSCTSAQHSCTGKGFWVRMQRDACTCQLELLVCCSTCSVPAVTLV